MIENLYFLSDSFRSISSRKYVRHEYRGDANSLRLIGFLPDPVSASAAVSTEHSAFIKVRNTAEEVRRILGVHKFSVNFFFPGDWITLALTGHVFINTFFIVSRPTSDIFFLSLP